MVDSRDCKPTIRRRTPAGTTVILRSTHPKASLPRHRDGGLLLSAIIKHQIAKSTRFHVFAGCRNHDTPHSNPPFQRRPCKFAVRHRYQWRPLLRQPATTAHAKSQQVVHGSQFAAHVARAAQREFILGMLPAMGVSGDIYLHAQHQALAAGAPTVMCEGRGPIALPLLQQVLDAHSNGSHPYVLLPRPSNKLILPAVTVAFVGFMHSSAGQ